jgi:hypothetical protein
VAVSHAEAEQGHRGIVYRRDIAAGTLTQVSTLPLVNAPDRVAFNESPSISGDGRTIAYAAVQKYRLETTPGIVYVLATGVVHLIDAASNAIRASYPGASPRVSRNGEFLAFIEDVGLLPFGVLARVHLASGERQSTAASGSPGRPPRSRRPAATSPWATKSPTTTTVPTCSRSSTTGSRSTSRTRRWRTPSCAPATLQTR